VADIGEFTTVPLEDAIAPELQAQIGMGRHECCCGVIRLDGQKNVNLKCLDQLIGENVIIRGNNRILPASPEATVPARRCGELRDVISGN
jgi:hypothetical protein